MKIKIINFIVFYHFHFFMVKMNAINVDMKTNLIVRSVHPKIINYYYFKMNVFLNG